MGKDLIIVESPAKIKTIKKFLGGGYEVEASVGHVRDLPTKTLGVDEGNDFAPDYQIIPGKSKVVSKLKSAAKAADTVYLAPDPDREGRGHCLARGRTHPYVQFECEAHSVQRNHGQGRQGSPGAPHGTAQIHFSTPSRPGASWIGWSDTRSVRSCGKKSSGVCPPAGFNP
jgi:hypothetical protein